MSEAVKKGSSKGTLFLGRRIEIRTGNSKRVLKYIVNLEDVSTRGEIRIRLKPDTKNALAPYKYLTISNNG